MIYAVPKLKDGRTWREHRTAKRAMAEAELRRVYALVDARDQGRCRVCGRRCSTTASSLADRAERHHLQPRSLGGPDTTANLATVCRSCHDERHTKGTLALSGNADHRDEQGRLAGIHVERITEAGWRTVGWS